jgi:hypothetical protein
MQTSSFSIAGSRQVTFEVERSKTSPAPKQDSYARTQQQRNFRSDHDGFSRNPRNFERPNGQGPRFSQQPVGLQQPREQRSDSTTRSHYQNTTFDAADVKMGMKILSTAQC